MSEENSPEKVYVSPDPDDFTGKKVATFHLSFVMQLGLPDVPPTGMTNAQDVSNEVINRLKLSVGTEAAKIIHELIYPGANLVLQDNSQTPTQNASISATAQLGPLPPTTEG